jgi:uncharacterized iron-regulated protein
MGGHITDPTKLENYFWSQSVWDETMAWRACEFQKTQAKGILVVIVGEFHVQYGGGLPERLRARGCAQVKTVSQVSTGGMSDSEKKSALEPHSKYGPRADWVWSIPTQE